MKDMRLTIVTGMSGAGKSSALKMLEDMGFYCVDNLPIPLVGTFASLVGESKGEIIFRGLRAIQSHCQVLKSI